MPRAAACEAVAGAFGIFVHLSIKFRWSLLTSMSAKRKIVSERINLKQRILRISSYACRVKMAALWRLFKNYLVRYD